MANKNLWCGLLTTVPSQGPILLHREDWALLQDVRLDLACCSKLDSARIHVAVIHRRVRLWGLVESKDQEDLAVALVTAVPGVAEVENDLQIDGGGCETGPYPPYQARDGQHGLKQAGMTGMESSLSAPYPGQSAGEDTTGMP